MIFGVIFGRHFGHRSSNCGRHFELWPVSLSWCCFLVVVVVVVVEGTWGMECGRKCWSVIGCLQSDGEGDSSDNLDPEDSASDDGHVDNGDGHSLKRSVSVTSFASRLHISSPAASSCCRSVGNQNSVDVGRFASHLHIVGVTQARTPPAHLHIICVSFVRRSSTEFLFGFVCFCFCFVAFFYRVFIGRRSVSGERRRVAEGQGEGRRRRLVDGSGQPQEGDAFVVCFCFPLALLFWFSLWRLRARRHKKRKAKKKERLMRRDAVFVPFGCCCCCCCCCCCFFTHWVSFSFYLSFFFWRHRPSRDRLGDDLMKDNWRRKAKRNKMSDREKDQDNCADQRRYRNKASFHWNFPCFFP